MVNNKLSNTIDYFLDSDKKTSDEITQQLHRDFEDVFNGIRCFDGTFLLWLKLDSKPYQMPPRPTAYVLQKLVEEELKWLQEQDIIMPLGVDETAEGSNSFVLVPKANGRVRLCIDPAQLNQAPIGPVYRRPSLNDILPKLNNVKYLSLMDVSSGYHNLKLDERSSYLMMFALEVTGTNDYCVELHWQETCSRGKLMKYLKNCLMYSVLLTTF